MTAEAIRFETMPGVVSRAACPVCEKSTRAVCLTREEIAAELKTRDRFFRARLDGRRWSSEPLRDLTDVVFGVPAAILRCMRCGVLIRDAVPGEEMFREDRYDDRELQLLHETHVRAFDAKERDYRSLLPPDAQVFEVGAYVGGFLSTAETWGWRASGADIGPDPARFCRALGLDVQCLAFEECDLDARALDAVFLWNCFEQMTSPAETLVEAHRVLRDAGLLVIRVPDADYYLQHEEQHALAGLAYNGLLGWPHRFGYDAATLRRLVQRHGFTFVRMLRRPAVRPHREDMHPWAREEEARILGDADHGWIELTFRRG